MDVDIDFVLARLGAEVVKVEMLERRIQALEFELKKKDERPSEEDAEG